MTQPTKAAKAKIATVIWLAERAGLSVPELLSRAGVAYTTWWRWQKGESEPSLDTMAKLEAVRRAR